MLKFQIKFSSLLQNKFCIEMIKPIPPLNSSKKIMLMVSVSGMIINELLKRKLN